MRKKINDPSIPANCVGFLVREGDSVVPYGLTGFPATPSDQPECNSPDQVYELVRDMGELRKEHMRALYLDARGCLIKMETISIGTLTGCLVHPREVMEPAVRLLAAKFILAHNHPSRNSSPSPEDLALTRRLRQAGDILGIELLDHLIVGGDNYVSLKARGEL